MSSRSRATISSTSACPLWIGLVDNLCLEQVRKVSGVKSPADMVVSMSIGIEGLHGLSQIAIVRRRLEVRVDHAFLVKSGLGQQDVLPTSLVSRQGPTGAALQAEISISRLFHREVGAGWKRGIGALIVPGNQTSLQYVGPIGRNQKIVGATRQALVVHDDHRASFTQYLGKSNRGRDAPPALRTTKRPPSFSFFAGDTSASFSIRPSRHRIA